MLRFDDSPEGRLRFDLLYEGLVVGSSMLDAGPTKPSELRRLEGSLLTKLETISKEKLCPKSGDVKKFKTGDVIRELVAPASLDLAEDEVLLLVKCVDGLDWRISIVRQVDATLVWLRNGGS